MFAVVNGLGSDGHLSEGERRWWESNNKWFEGNLTDPAKVYQSVFDRHARPYTSSWFLSTALEFVHRTRGYLEILDEHGVAWVELQSCDPGPVVYRDELQVVVAARHDPERLEDGIAIRSRSQLVGADHTRR